MQVYKGGKQYTFEDMKTLYHKSDFHSWDEMVSYLEENERKEFGEGKAGHMIFDLKNLRDKDVPFVEGYTDALRLAQEHGEIHEFS